MYYREAYYGKDFSDISSQLGEKITLSKINSVSNNVHNMDGSCLIILLSFHKSPSLLV